jgi:small subunit ribosomal protein S17
MSDTTDTAAGAPRTHARRIGTVHSARMDKTIVVRVERRVMHPVYKKYVRRFTKLYAHDEQKLAREGDTVEVVFSRPLSRLKRWRLARVVRAAASGAGGEG